MILCIKGHRYGYELQRVAQMFYFGEKVTVVENDLHDSIRGDVLFAILEGSQLLVQLRIGTELILQKSSDDLYPECEISQDAQECVFGVMIYQLLSKVTGLRPPWGVLTGIRPVKLFLRRMRQGMDEATLQDYFLEKRLLEKSRFDLALCIAKLEQPILARSTGDSFSLYISIPFCPSRCAYCSFVSHSVEKSARLIPEYIERICEEIAHTAEIADRLGLKLRTVYFGGGTPTSISAGQLEQIMQKVASSFDLSRIWEYTVEAGRPDTITPEKLAVIRKFGAGRISINPQTLSDSVLKAIGRKHTVAQCMEQYDIARKMGFDINMDLIAGLPTDNFEGFCHSVEGLIAAQPENITVHTLTVKRAARLSLQDAAAELDAVRAMVDEARKLLTNAGYMPYYLYRQNGTLAGLENVGYAREGKECLYNVYMMDETHSVLAAGAGASTRLCHPTTGDIGRFYNHKYPYEYLERFDDVIKRKTQIETFFGSCNNLVYGV